MHPDTYLNSEDETAVYFFSVPYDALNNWSAHSIKIWGKIFATVEHAYHYSKFIDQYTAIAQKIIDAPSPWAAKQISIKYKDKIRQDWTDVNIGIMEELLHSKMLQNIDVNIVLKKTAGRIIVENSPWDSFWGAGADGLGENMMGKLWMKVRDSDGK